MVTFPQSGRRKAGLKAVAGCTPSTNYCDLAVRATHIEQDITASVDTHNVLGAPLRLTATASLPGVCGSQVC